MDYVVFRSPTVVKVPFQLGRCTSKSPWQRMIPSMHSILKFNISLNGRQILFLAPDEKSKEVKSPEESGDGLVVFGKWSYTRPYVLGSESFEVTKLYTENAKVKTFACPPDVSQTQK
jgi:hypothetical protein